MWRVDPLHLVDEQPTPGCELGRPRSNRRGRVGDVGEEETAANEVGGGAGRGTDVASCCTNVTPGAGRAISRNAIDVSTPTVRFAPVVSAASRVDAPGPHPRSKASRGDRGAASARKARVDGSSASLRSSSRSAASGVSPNM
jgi:hypothetical protein